MLFLFTSILPFSAALDANLSDYITSTNELLPFLCAWAATFLTLSAALFSLGADSKSMLLHPKNCGSLSLVSLDDSNEQPASAQNNLQLNTPAATFGRVPKEDQHSSQPGMQQTSSQPRGLERTIWRNFHDSETYSGALPPVSVEDLRVSSIAQFVKRRAVRALDDPAWKRTYEESYSQVM
jgi:hypothetical protein